MATHRYTHTHTTINIHPTSAPWHQPARAQARPWPRLPAPTGSPCDPEPTPARPEVRRASMHETRGVRGPF